MFRMATLRRAGRTLAIRPLLRATRQDLKAERAARLRGDDVSGERARIERLLSALEEYVDRAGRVA